MRNVSSAIYRELLNDCGAAACCAKLAQTAIGRFAPGSPLYRALSRRKHAHILRYIRRESADLLAKYADAPERAERENDGDIWMLWWQGEEGMPQSVKNSVANIRAMSGGRAVHLIDKDNYRDYVPLAPEILARVEAGKMSLAHLSDYIRYRLLRDYGGLWVDASFYLATEIPRYIWEMPFYSARMPSAGTGEFVSECRWVIGLMGAPKGSKLFSFLVDFFERYWAGHDALVDYLLTDYAIVAAMRAIPDVRRALDALPVNNQFIYRFGQRGSEAMAREELARLTEDTQFFRISWKIRCDETTRDGKTTWYGYFCGLGRGEGKPC